MNEQDNFTGCKLAYIFEGKLLVYLRDNLAHIPFPGMWDFPGGGREGSESPEACVLRELQEEFGIELEAERFVYKQQVTNHTKTGYAFFFVAEGRAEEIDSIIFGSEGQYWQLMRIQEFLDHPLASPALKPHLAAYLATKI
jgi:8-oxo-dGTP diphosphatase